MTSKPVIVERTYGASMERVWRAITEIDQIRRWFLDSIDAFLPEVGFEFTFCGGKDGRTYTHRCRVTEVIQGKKLTYSWRYEGNEGDSLVTFELFAERAGTRLKLTHEGIETFPSSNPDFAVENFIEGWTHLVGVSIRELVNG